MSRKQTIFIASSKEGENIAQKVKEFLEPDFLCIIWSDRGIFQFNHSTFDTLIRKSAAVDMAIIVATADDSVYSRKKSYEAIRDNVLFEAGLFLGRLGANRSYIIADEKVKIPTDYSGISLPFFSTKKGGQLLDENKFSETLSLLKDTMLEASLHHDFHLLPATSLAIGYFNNFVLPCANAIHSEELYSGEKDKLKCKLKILIPTRLEIAYANCLQVLKLHNYVDDKIQSDARIFGVLRNTSETSYKEFVDIPTTLGTLAITIDKVFPTNYVGVCNEKQILYLSQQNLFKDTIEFLINENQITKRYVETRVTDFDRM